MRLERRGQDIVFFDIDCFSLPLTLSCGQAFRWRKEGALWRGIAEGRELSVSQTGTNLIFHGVSDKDVPFWSNYFDLETDYARILRAFSADETLRDACGAYCGIRILRQDPWEALCTFILSSNNNIQRIAGMVDRLCLLCGERIGEDSYTFPEPEKLSSLPVEALAPVRAGYRAKYILGAARCVAAGEIDFGALKVMPLDSARAALLKIPGVGPKVADCALLYGCRRLDAVPRDVWINRVIEETYPKGLPACVCGYEGVAQQYLFHWRRNQTE